MKKESTNESLLNKTLESAKKWKHSPVAVIAGSTGSGKTASVLAWLKDNKLKYQNFIAPCFSPVKMKVKYSEIDELSKVSKPQIKMVNNKELEDLMKEKENEVNVTFTSEQIDSFNQETILVFDNYDLASQETREELLKLIKDLYVIDPRVPGKDKIKKVNPLMIIVIMDTFNIALNKPLSDEELKLFGLANEKGSK